MGDNALKIIRQRVIKEFNDLREEIGIINLSSTDYADQVTEIFVSLEFIRFIDYEIENEKENMLKVSMQVYEIINKDIDNILQCIIDYYYNTDMGTTYQNFADLLNSIADFVQDK